MLGERSRGVPTHLRVWERKQSFEGRGGVCEKMWGGVGEHIDGRDVKGKVTGEVVWGLRARSSCPA